MRHKYKKYKYSAFKNTKKNWLNEFDTSTL